MPIISGPANTPVPGENEALREQGAADAVKTAAKREQANKAPGTVAPAALKDMLVKRDGAALVQALLTVVTQTPEREPDADTTLAAFAPLKALLGKPNGLPVPDESFVHADLDAVAGVPLALSPPATAVLASPQPEWLDKLLQKSGVPVDAKIRVAYVKHLQALSDKLLTTPPLAPPSTQALLAEKLPQLTAALRDFLKGSGNKKKDTDIELPDSAVVAVEEAMSFAGAQAEVIHAPFSGFDIERAGVEAAIYFIMMQSTAMESSMLTDQMHDMQAVNKQKADMRAHMSKMKRSQSHLDEALQQELDYLKKHGAVAKSVTLDDYRTWRQVTWTPDGDAVLAQPMPELPNSLIFGADGPPDTDAPPPSTGGKSYPCDPKVARDLADKYGLLSSDIGYLYGYWAWANKGHSGKFGKDDIPDDFEKFLTQMVGLKKGQPGKNADALTHFLDHVVAHDAGKTDEQHTPEPGDCSPDRVHLFSQTWSDDQLAQGLIDALEKDPFKDDPAVKAFLAGFEQQPSVLPSSSRLIIALMASPGLAKAVGKLQPYGEAMAMLVVFADRKDYKSKDVPTPEDFAKDVGAPDSCIWGPGAAAADYEDYWSLHRAMNGGIEGDQDDDAQRQIAGDLYDSLMHDRPFTDEPQHTQIKNLLADIAHWVQSHEDPDCHNPRTAFQEFFENGWFDDAPKQMTIDLVNAVESNPPGNRNAVILLAFEGVENQDETYDGQNISVATLANYLDSPEAKARKHEAEPPPPDPDAPPEKDKHSFTALLLAHHKRDQRREQREIAARAAAEEEAVHRRERARTQVEALRTNPNDVPGAQTGSSTDYDNAISAYQDKMDSLSDLSDTEQMRLQTSLDRRQKMLEALSNTMKKLSNTADTINQNSK